MRTSLILVRRHDDDSFVLWQGPEVSYVDQTRVVRDLLIERVSGVHPDFTEVQFWVSDSGLNRRLQFRKPAATEAPGKPEPSGHKSSKKAEKKTVSDWQ